MFIGFLAIKLQHLGGIYDYLRAHNADSINAALTSAQSAPVAATVEATPSAGKQNYAEHKEQQKKIRKAEKAVKECEDRIAKLEKRKKEIDDLLMKPENATNMELVTEYTSLMQKLDEENDNWLLLSEKLEEVSNS